MITTLVQLLVSSRSGHKQYFKDHTLDKKGHVREGNLKGAT